MLPIDTRGCISIDTNLIAENAWSKLQQLLKRIIDNYWQKHGVAWFLVVCLSVRWRKSLDKTTANGKKGADEFKFNLGAHWELSCNDPSLIEEERKRKNLMDNELLTSRLFFYQVFF